MIFVWNVWRKISDFDRVTKKKSFFTQISERIIPKNVFYLNVNKVYQCWCWENDEPSRNSNTRRLFACVMFVCLFMTAQLQLLTPIHIFCIILFFYPLNVVSELCIKPKAKKKLFYSVFCIPKFAYYSNLRILEIVTETDLFSEFSIFVLFFKTDKGGAYRLIDCINSMLSFRHINLVFEYISFVRKAAEKKAGKTAIN